MKATEAERGEKVEIIYIEIGIVFHNLGMDSILVLFLTTEIQRVSLKNLNQLGMDSILKRYYGHRLTLVNTD